MSKNGVESSLLHIALFPSAGMGHLTPFLRLAAMLSSKSCMVTLITAKPTVSVAESVHLSSFISAHPQIKHLEFEIIQTNPVNVPSTNDPFFLQFKAVNQSAHLLRPLLLSSSPPLSAIFYDLFVASSISPLAVELCIPNYIVSTTSAKFFSLTAYLPFLAPDPKTSTNNSHDAEIQIPGLSPLHASNIPPPFWSKDHLFTSLLIENAQLIPKADGVIMNTFNFLEPETLDALSNGLVLENFPQVVPIGPFESYSLENDDHKKHSYVEWLDEQPAKSVVYVSFGSRTTMTEDQIRELGSGLDKSNHKFLWVLKTSKVDKDDKKDLADLLENSFLEKTSSKGMLVKSWVNQEKILGHAAIGGFVNHCGWNSVTEAARHGVPVLAWPQHGDQRVNAEVVEKAGLGIWERAWGWGGQKLVDAVVIADKIGMLMDDEKLHTSAAKVCEEARKARAYDGSSNTILTSIIAKLGMGMGSHKL